MQGCKLNIRRAKFNNAKSFSLTFMDLRKYAVSCNLISVLFTVELQLKSPTSSQIGGEGEDHARGGTVASKEKDKGWRGTYKALELTYRMMILGANCVM